MIHIVHFYLFPVPQSSMQQDTHQSPSQSFPGPFNLPAPQPVIPFPLRFTVPTPRIALPTMSPGNLNSEPGVDHPNHLPTQSSHTSPEPFTSVIPDKVGWVLRFLWRAVSDYWKTIPISRSNFISTSSFTEEPASPSEHG